MQPTLTLHCPKLVQNIKIRILCDVRVYTRKILRSSVFSFPPSWIWAIGVSSRSQSHELQKWRPRSKRHVLHWMDKMFKMYWGQILKSYKIVCHSKNLLDVFIQKLPSKIYKMCSISGIKRHQKKLSSLSDSCNFLLMGHFPAQQALLRNEGLVRVFAVHATGVQEMYKR